MGGEGKMSVIYLVFDSLVLIQNSETSPFVMYAYTVM